MLKQFEVYGTVREIGDVKTIETSKGDIVQLITFILSYNIDNNKLIKFDMLGRKKIERFLRFNDIGKEVRVFFTINAKQHDKGYINNVLAHSFWTPLKQKGYMGNPEFPVEKH